MYVKVFLKYLNLKKFCIKRFKTVLKVSKKVKQLKKCLKNVSTMSRKCQENVTKNVTKMSLKCL